MNTAMQLPCLKGKHKQSFWFNARVYRLFDSIDHKYLSFVKFRQLAVSSSGYFIFTPSNATLRRWENQLKILAGTGPSRKLGYQWLLKFLGEMRVLREHWHH